MADDFQRNHQRGKPPDRPHEVPGVTNRPLFPDAMEVVINEGHYGAAQGHVNFSRGRFKSRYQSQQVAEQDEKEHGGKKRDEAASVVPDDFVRLSTDKFVE